MFFSLSIITILPIIYYICTNSIAPIYTQISCSSNRKFRIKIYLFMFLKMLQACVYKQGFLLIQFRESSIYILDYYWFN